MLISITYHECDLDLGQSRWEDDPLLENKMSYIKTQKSFLKLHGEIHERERQSQVSVPYIGSCHMRLQATLDHQLALKESW